jgi:hypothetical protein
MCQQAQQRSQQQQLVPRAVSEPGSCACSSNCDTVQRIHVHVPFENLSFGNSIRYVSINVIRALGMCWACAAVIQGVRAGCAQYTCKLAIRVWHVHAFHVHAKESMFMQNSASLVQ